MHQTLATWMIALAIAALAVTNVLLEVQVQSTSEQVQAASTPMVVHLPEVAEPEQDRGEPSV